MSNQQKDFLINLTAAEMKKLLVARERIEILIAEKRKLTSDLDKIELELTRLLDGAGQSNAPGSKLNKTQPIKKSNSKRKTQKASEVKKVAKKKATKNKATKNKATKNKATKKKVSPKAAVKFVKKTNRKKKSSKKVSVSGSKNTGRVKLEDVVAKVIKANGGPMSYKELISLIVKKKLFVSKSSNFDNVLRRTLSTSKLIKRVGRGVYSLA